MRGVALKATRGCDGTAACHSTLRERARACMHVISISTHGFDRRQQRRAHVQHSALRTDQRRNGLRHAVTTATTPGAVHNAGRLNTAAGMSARENSRGRMRARPAGTAREGPGYERMGESAGESGQGAQLAAGALE